MLSTLVAQNVDASQCFALVACILFLIFAVMEKSILAAGLAATALAIMFLA